MYILRLRYEYDGEYLYSHHYDYNDAVQTAHGLVWQVNQISQIIRREYSQDKAVGYLNREISEEYKKYGTDKLEPGFFDDYCYLRINPNDDPELLEIVNTKCAVKPEIFKMLRHFRDVSTQIEIVEISKNPVLIEYAVNPVPFTLGLFSNIDYLAIFYGYELNIELFNEHFSRFV